MRRIPSSLLVALAFAFACSANEPKESEEPPGPPSQPTNATKVDDKTPPPPKKAPSVDSRVDKSFNEADLVIVARPKALEPSPNIWSGTLATFQGVEHQVVRVLKGTGVEVEQTIVVMHPLVARSATAETDKPELRASAFDSSKTYVVFIRIGDDKELYCIDANHGIVEATPEVIAEVERLAGG